VRVFLGYDQREQAAYDVARHTAESFGCQVTPVYEDQLRAQGLLTRPLDRRGGMYDLHSNAPQATDFAISRFFVPILAHTGWALFADCDVVFLRDPNTLYSLIGTGDKAVYVVKHPPLDGGGTKMDGQAQTAYQRKCWSSVMFFNCDHPANKRLNLTTLNQWPGRDLHALGWLADSEIGELSQDWNWLVNVRLAPAHPAIAHFTKGGPWFADWERQPHDEIWLEAQRNARK
jgi:lipopolysaccharide biosynthesis glycosyltransferase